MINIRTRAQLIEWLVKNPPSLAIKRAIEEGSIEHLGGFMSACPYWLIRVTSPRFKKTWLIKIVYHRFIMAFVDTMNGVPWDRWVGDRSTNALYTGDSPKQYKEFKENARKTKEQ